VLRNALRALVVAFYTLAGAAIIVDTQAAGGLPKEFPLLAELRQSLGRFVPQGRSPDEGAVASLLPDRGLDAYSDASSWEDLPEGAMVPSVTLPAGNSGVRVNRGVP
jgi:hypothetical protein